MFNNYSARAFDFFSRPKFLSSFYHQHCKMLKLKPIFHASFLHELFHRHVIFYIHKQTKTNEAKRKMNRKRFTHRTKMERVRKMKTKRSAYTNLCICKCCMELRGTISWTKVIQSEKS